MISERIEARLNFWPCTALGALVLRLAPDAPADPNIHSSDVRACYRETEKSRIVASLKAATSLLVLSETGAGKSALAEFVAAELAAEGFAVAMTSATTAKQTAQEIAHQCGLSLYSIEGKQATTAQLQEAIGEHLKSRTVFIIADDAHRLPTATRHWLGTLHNNGAPLLLVATHPPRRDIFLKLPRIELKALHSHDIRAIMRDEAASHAHTLTRAQQAGLEERCGGNPMLARRVVREELLGLDATAPDHQQWIDGMPILIAGCLCFALVRVVARGFHQRDLWMFGMVLSIALGLTRLLFRSLPRQGGKLGQ